MLRLIKYSNCCSEHTHSNNSLDIRQIANKRISFTALTRKSLDNLKYMRPGTITCSWRNGVFSYRYFIEIQVEMGLLIKNESLILRNKRRSESKILDENTDILSYVLSLKTYLAHFLTATCSLFQKAHSRVPLYDNKHVAFWCHKIWDFVKLNFNNDS